jgi:hypothetical protein
MSLLFGLALFLIYLANRRETTIGDSMPAKFLTLALLRGDGVHLDRYAGHAQLQHPTEGGLGHWAGYRRGHIVSLYPVAPALVVLPVGAPLVFYFDRRHPGWNVSHSYNWRFDFIAKTCAAAIAALTGVVLLHLLQALGVGRMAPPATAETMLGSNLWMTASQTLWQHGPAALALTLALLLLMPARPSHRRLVLAGLAAAVTVACRPTAAVFAVAIALGVGWRRPRDLPWFLAAASPVALALTAYNWWFFGSLRGGYHELSWGTTPAVVLSALRGTLVSPNRGLFVFSPWVVLALLTLPDVAMRLKPHPVVRWTLAAIPIHLAVVSVWPCWWAGCSFGPRFWTEVTPLFGVILGLGMSWSWRRSRVVFGAFLLAIAWSIGVQAVGALCYPSSWNGSPVYVDDHPERL